MAFDSAGAYGRFMGRFSEPLALEFVQLAPLEQGSRVLDVGCGPGVLTAVLADRLGADRVAAIDPSTPFVEAARERVPGAEIRVGSAEELPYDDGSFDAALAQLVVHFMTDPVQGLREMARVTRPGGVVAACVWDNAGDRGPLSLFWSTVRELDSAAKDESGLAGARHGHLGQLFSEAGLADIEEPRLDVTVAFPSFEDWWEPYTMGVGPAGDYVARLDEAAVSRLADACRERLPEGPFDLTASAWAARGVVQD